jgi:elongation factor Ts
MIIIQSYLHGEGIGIPANIGVLVEIESDIKEKAKREQLDKLGREIAMHIAATNPSHIGDRRIQEFSAALEDDEEPKDLLIQSWIKDPDKLIGELVFEYESKIGSSIRINRFVRYATSDT